MVFQDLVIAQSYKFKTRISGSFPLYHHPVSLPLSMHLYLSSLCDKTIIEGFLSIH